MPPGSRHAAPIVVRPDQTVVRLERLHLGKSERDQGYREGFVQRLVHEHPDIIPMAEIEPAFMPLIPICRELATVAGDLDNLWLTPDGGIVLGEAKLFRNPEARREVIAQALDYARAIAGMHYQDLEAAVRKALKSPTASIWALVRNHTDLQEAEFIDAVERRLRQSRFLLLIIGDGIQEGVESLTSHLQLHAGLHVGLALVDLSIWRDDQDRLLVLPRIPLRTTLVERGIVVVDAAGQARIDPPKMPRDGRVGQTQRAQSLSEPEFFDQLEQRRPGLSELIRKFLDDVSELGIEPDFQKSLILRWSPAPSLTATAGYFDTGGRVWVMGAWSSSKRLGAVEAGERYFMTLEAIAQGKAKFYGDGTREVLGQDGRGIDAARLLARAEDWKVAIARLIEDTARGADG